MNNPLNGNGIHAKPVHTGIVITGYWDGQPIWRHKTAEEALLEQVERNMADRKREKEKQLTK